MNSEQTSSWKRLPGFNMLGIVVLLAVVLLLLFHEALGPGKVHFSNDGPLGAQMAQSHRLPEFFKGGWEDLNTVGFSMGSALANVSYAFQWLVGPVGFAKGYAPFSLLILGLGAWTFFRQLKLSPVACLLGALAASLNSGFFSAACWGVASHPLAIGMSYFAMAALVDDSSKRRWIRLALGGFAVGVCVFEGADIGAIFSIMVATFVLYQSWVKAGKHGFPLGVLRVGLVALPAMFIAAQAIVTIVGTQISGMAGMQQDSQTKEQRWDWATQWSLPKREALGFVAPGVFGYRMDTPDGGNYWGAVGRDPAWDRYFASGKQGQPPQGFMRFSGGGVYAGILVALVAFWAMLQGLRKKDSVFPLHTRKWLWFWSAVMLVSLLLAFGRFAPFYQLLYALPYFSTIRNPAKFTHVVNWALVVLFAYGVHGLCQRYMMPETAPSGFGLKGWWKRVKGFDRHWTVGCLAALGASALGWLIYASSSTELIRYLQEVRIDETLATSVARFSIGQVGWSVLLFALAIASVTLVLSGTFAGPRSKWGALLLGLFLVLDLGRANQPWVVAWDYKQKYSTNPIIDRLREKPYLQRVAILPGWMHQVAQAPPQLQLLDQLYGIEWAQHHFLYYNIQSLDVIQMPRMPADLAAFEGALQPRSMADVPHLLTRRWELTNTRYLLGPAEYVSLLLNPQIDPQKTRFAIAERFNIVPKPGADQLRGAEGWTAEPATNGAFALIEFQGALPRAKLYANWEVNTNLEASLEKLVSPGFDPQETVLVSSPLPGSPTPAGTNQAAGNVEFTSYAPKDLVLKASAQTNAVLLLNDRYDVNWKVYVDGKPAPLLQANYLMRGVLLTPGEHKVEFKFEPQVNSLYVSLTAWVVALLLLAALCVLRDPKGAPEAPAAKATA